MSKLLSIESCIISTFIQSSIVHMICTSSTALLTDMTILLKPKSLCSGQTAMSPMAVVQLGLAINFFPLVVSALISGTTNGIPSL
jgi:hypothetical protein